MMDPTTGPPRSVEIQRELEERIDLVRDAIKPIHVATVVLIAVIGYAIATGDGAEAASSTSTQVEGVTIAEVAKGVAIVTGAGIAFGANVAIHEQCHRLAFQHFRVASKVEINWPRLGGHRVYLFPAGGVCSAVSLREFARLRWHEDAIVSLAPAAWGVVVVAGVIAYHVFVDPFTSLKWVVLAAFLLSGPSIPDYGSLLETPRERWEFLVGLEDAVDRHAAAEGLEP